MEIPLLTWTLRDFQEFPRISQKFPRNLPEISQKFPGIFKHSFFKYFRYFLDNYKQRYIREPQGIPIWTPFGGPGAPQGPPKSTPRAFEWQFLAHLTVNTIQMMIFGAKIAILAPILEARGLSNRPQNAK